MNILNLFLLILFLPIETTAVEYWKSQYETLACINNITFNVVTKTQIKNISLELFNTDYIHHFFEFKDLAWYSFENKSKRDFIKIYNENKEGNKLYFAYINSVDLFKDIISLSMLEQYSTIMPYIIISASITDQIPKNFDKINNHPIFSTSESTITQYDYRIGEKGQFSIYFQRKIIANYNSLYSTLILCFLIWIILIIWWTIANKYLPNKFNSIHGWLLIDYQLIFIYSLVLLYHVFGTISYNETDKSYGSGDWLYIILILVDYWLKVILAFIFIFPDLSLNLVQVNETRQVSNLSNIILFGAFWTDINKGKIIIFYTNWDWCEIINLLYNWAIMTISLYNSKFIFRFIQKEQREASFKTLKEWKCKEQVLRLHLFFVIWFNIIYCIGFFILKIHYYAYSNVNVSFTLCLWSYFLQVFFMCIAYFPNSIWRRKEFHFKITPELSNDSYWNKYHYQINKKDNMKKTDYSLVVVANPFFSYKNSIMNEGEDRFDWNHIWIGYTNSN